MGLTNNYLFFYWNLRLGDALITYTETLKENKGGQRKQGNIEYKVVLTVTL
jgi:hypothetical protein